MYVARLVLAIGLVVMFGLVVADNRIGYRDPQWAGVTVNATAAWWKKVLVRWNDHVRFGGLLIFSLGMSADAVLVRHHQPDIYPVPMVIAGIGLLLYAWAFAWRRLLTVRDNRVA